MKHGFRNGLIVGLLMGVVIGFFTSHFWGWLFLGVAIGIVLVASGMWRPKFFRSHAAGQ